jgi:ABC-2 type transport system permease protein
MFAIFSNTLSRNRGGILAWGIALGLYALALVGMYDRTLEMRPTLEAALESYPPELMALIGEIPALFTPSGFLDTYVFSYMALIVGIYAVLVGSGLLASDEESGVLDLLISHPISRVELFLGRLLGFLAATGLILALMWAGAAVAAPGTTIGVNATQLAGPHISLFAFLALFGGLATFLSMALPSRRLAASVAGLILFASFMATMMISLAPDLEPLSQVSPFAYYQGGEALTKLNWTWVAGLLGVALLFDLGALVLFLRRDIRVAGERGWALPKWPFYGKERAQESQLT